MLTASGDKTVALSDTLVGVRIATFRGHSGSVKSVCPWAAAPGVLASAARDGCVQARTSRLCCLLPWLPGP